MTRINSSIRPIQLVDAHLFAEYRELKRIPNTIKLGRAVIKDIPEQFTLGTGHVKFFYDKLKYLHNRSNSLYEELIRRKYNIEDYSSCFEDLPPHLYNDWDDGEAKSIIVERITERLTNMKNLKYNHIPITLEQSLQNLNL